MDDTDELQDEARASNSGAEPVHEVASNKESIDREEGELSSENDDLGDDDEKHGTCIVASTGMVIHQKVPVSLALEKSNPGIKDGEAVYDFSTVSSLNLQSQMSTQPTFKEKFDKNKTFPATTSGLGPVFNGSSNLVISFSDNDSGSGDEENIEGRDSKPQNDFVKNRRPPTSLQAMSHRNSHTFKNASKVITKKLPLHRSFAPSMTKNRGSFSMAARPAFLEQGSRLRGFNTLNRSQLNPEPGFDQSLSLNDSKLKDLREQIALRENELKLKSVPLNKESIPVRNQNDMYRKDAKGLKNSAILAEFMQVEPKEPDKKRLKGSGSYTTQQFSGGPQELPLANKKIVSPSALLEVDNCHLHDSTYSDHVKKDILIARSPSKMDQHRKHNHMQGDSLPENVPRQQDGSPISNHLNHSDEGKQTITNLNHRSNIGGQLTSTSNPTTAKQLVRSDFRKEISNHETRDPLENTCQGPIIKRINGDDVEMTDFMDVKSIVEIEESIDKDLEEVQEHRHRCEIAERNAFKAYRQAQRTLAEANARCVDLYRKRELYAAHIRSLMIESSSSMFSLNDHVGISDALANVPENNLLPRPDLQIQPEFQGFGLLQNDSNTQLANSDIHSSNQEVSEHVMESEPCTEPAGVISEGLPYEGKTITDRSIEPSIKYLLKVRDAEGGKKINDEAKGNDFSENVNDSLLLEARLRYELVQKLGKRNLQKNNDSCHDLGPERERGSQADVRNENSLLNNVEPHVNKEFLRNLECDKNQKSKMMAPASDIKENQRRDLKEGNQPEFSSCLKSVFQHVKAIPQVSLEFLVPKRCRSFSSQNYDEEDNFIKFNGFQLWKSPSSSTHETVGYFCGREIGSYSCNVIIDSYLPICMYELRGKCNNDECPWQHIKKVPKENMNQHHDQRSNYSGMRADDEQSVMKCQDSTIPTTYIVGLEILKSNPSAYGSCLISRSDGSWKKYFSISLTLSISSQKDMNVDGTFFHDGRVEVHESYNKLAFLQSRNTEIQVRQAFTDSEQSLEMALLILNQEANKLDGLKKALPVLSRAVEADPTSAVIWIVFLLVFYSTINSAGKDDMFSFAVKQIDRSYELWLLYINSRMQLDVRLNAYEDAISALCYHATFDSNGFHDSACILDLFLQMISCLCISGHIDKAVEKILSAIPISRNSGEEGHFGLFSDILTCLTVSDKCIFWVSCLYLVIYGKLPDVFVQQFECEKELNELEWPEVHLTDSEKWRVIQLIETAVDNFDSCLSAESCKSKDNLRSAQVFALNRIRCVLAFNGVDSGRNLLDKYAKLYPFCLELILLSARTDKNGQDGVNFKGFEECLKNWPKEVPGIQCVWNQYAEYALQNGRYEYAKELMALWFDSVWTVGNLENGSWDLAIRDSDSNQIDVLFGYINLSLYMLLQNNLFEARLAIDNGLKAASPDTLSHCLKEYATFLLSDESLLKEVASIGGIRSIFEGYINNVCALSALKPLSRNFVAKIKKPRVQQLVVNLLNPFSPNFSLMNLVLEAWFGPSLLPRNFKEPKDLVDFVETIMEILPSNYKLAISVCKLFSELTVPSFLFWAGLNLINAIFHAIPIPPEFVWVEAGVILGTIMGMEAMIDKFYKRGLSVYPFSIKLWKSYYDLHKTREDASHVKQTAKARGIELV